jgi:hypothetical protein
MTQTLKAQTGQSLSESLDLHQQFLDGNLSYEQYQERQREAALARPRTQPGALGNLITGLLVGAAAYALWREVTRK